MNAAFVIDKEGTLVEFLGVKRKFQVVRNGKIVSNIELWDKEGAPRVTVPGTVKHIEYGAFNQCHNLRTVFLNEGTETIQMFAFDGTALKDLWVPQKSLRWCSLYAFSPKESVTLHVTYVKGAWPALRRAGYVLHKLPMDLREAHRGLFQCLLMARKQFNVNLHVRNKKDVSDKEFAGMPPCTVTFHDDICSKYLFRNSRVNRVVIDEGVSYIDPDTFRSDGEPYFDDTDINRIDVSSGNAAFYSLDGILFNAKHDLLVFPHAKQVPGGCYQVPSGTRQIVPGAFDGCFNIEKLVIPQGVVTLQDALANMPLLQEIERR